MKFISLGFQCTSALVLQEAGIRARGYPFDWGLCPPNFVDYILNLLLIQNTNVESLVREEFFRTDVLAQWTGPGYLANEEYREWEEGAPYNKQHGAIFPHDGKDAIPYEDSIEKYIRRMHRLKESILDTTEAITFLYMSQSSKTRYHGNYFIDGVEVITNAYDHLNSMYEIIQSVRGDTFNFVVLDTINSDDSVVLNPKIDYNTLPQSNGYKPMIPLGVTHIQKYK